MRQLRIFLTAWLLLLVGATASAALSSGYYYIKSYNSLYMTENIYDHSLVCSDKASSTSYAQVWYLSVSGSSVTLKNALTDQYVQGQGSFSQSYSTGTNQQTFTLGESGGVYTFQYDPYNAGGLHCDNSNTVVEWYTSDDKSKWTVESVTVNQTELNAQKNALTEATVSQLTQFFTSAACTELKSTYQNYSEDDLRYAMRDLPTVVRDMAVKVKNNSWTTYSGWDKTEKTFRIADYKAYSSHTLWSSILGMASSLGRLSNPTGIYVESGDVIQVYVGSIPNGQTVKLEVVGDGVASGPTYPLHEGMNALLMSSGGNCFVFYEVDNTTNGGAPFVKPSTFADVTVHIEGGSVQGYFDLTKGDTDTDWSNLKTYLLSAGSNVCLKTDKHVMNIDITRLNTVLSSSSMVAMLNVWRNLAQWEDELMGRSDSYGGEATYGQYCNNVFSVTSVGSGSPHATAYGTFYPPYSDVGIYSAEALMTVADNMWCIAHEQGHNRQKPINMAGNTEISNNLFSNMAVYNQGRFTSRTANIKDIFNDYLDGVSWPERVENACNSVGNYNQQLLHLNWQLYLYFHVNGNDPDFFPRLFDVLRADPMTKRLGDLTCASEDYLKYYVKCCEVSGYDLTDFFAAYGFFMLPPAKGSAISYGGVETDYYTTFNDYGTYYLGVTQSMIDAAKAEVAAMSGLKPCNIVFIEDRVTAPDATYDGHSAGEKKTINPDSPVKAFGDVGEMGQYTSYDTECSSYSYNVDESGHVTTSGTGAVGFIVYDNAGNIIGFYNTASFTLPDGISNYTIKAAAGDGSFKTASLDPSISVNDTDFPRTDKWYSFKSKGQSNRYVDSQGAGAGLVGTSAYYSSTVASDNSMQWRFVPRGNSGSTFDIINRDDNSYIDPTATWNTQVSTTATRPSSGWKVDRAGEYFIITSGGTQLNQTSYNQSYKIYNWGGGGSTEDNCLFTISEVADYEDPTAPTLSSTALEELNGYNISVSASAADNLVTGLWYVMFDRGITNGYPHGYLYEKVSEHGLYNTATVPSGTATNACKYLVRLIDAGNEKYYIQTGYGNYFGQIQQTTNPVPVIATKTQRITVAKIDNTDGHFYLQGETGGVILDANDLNAGDATVVGWGTSIPSSTGGNNDWAFYPVTLTRSLTLNAVGGKSYATFYLDADVQTDEGTKAYYITNADNGVLQLTTVGNEGHDIPAYTAVVLINTNAATSATLSLTSGLSSVVTATDNLLKGTLTGILLDLSTSSDYYSLGMNEGKVGFYKYNNGGTTTITLGANKAYLEVSSTTPSKGFVFGEETSSLDNLTIDNLTIGEEGIYDLLGRKVMSTLPDSQTPTLLRKGIYIVNGKKVIIK